MAAQELTVKTKKGEGDAVLEYKGTFDAGDNLQHAISLFGEGVVYDYFVAKANIAWQDEVRRMLAAGKTSDEITAHMADWKLGVRGPRGPVDPKVAASNALAKMDPEARKAFIKELQKKMAELAAA